MTTKKKEKGTAADNKDTSLVDFTENLERKAKARSTSRKIKETEHKLQIQVQMPIWEEDIRAYPNSLMRGALFTAGKTSNNLTRDYFESKRVATLAGVSIEYNGQELRQDDASVFMTLLHVARGTALGVPIYFTAYSILKELGWSLNTAEYHHLRSCFTRLSSNSITLIQGEGQQGFNGSLIRSFKWIESANQKSSHWGVILEPGIAQLYSTNSFTEMEWAQRKAITGRAPLAQWLHSFLATHQKPYAISVNKYHELSASKAANLADFRGRLHDALHRLIDVGFLAAYSISNDLVHVERATKGTVVKLSKQSRKKPFIALTNLEDPDLPQLA